MRQIIFCIQRYSNAYLQTKMNNGSIIDEKSLSSKLLYIYLVFMNSNCKHILLIYTYVPICTCTGMQCTRNQIILCRKYYLPNRYLSNRLAYIYNSLDKVSSGRYLVVYNQVLGSCQKLQGYQYSCRIILIQKLTKSQQRKTMLKQQSQSATSMMFIVYL